MAKRWQRGVALAALCGLAATAGLAVGSWWTEGDRRGGAVGLPGGCPSLAEMEPVEVVSQPQSGADRTGWGYRNREVNALLAPAGRLAAPFVRGPLGLHWDEEKRTFTVLGPEDVLSVHFPEGRDQADRAVLNGEVIALESVLCQAESYIPLATLAKVLQVRVRWREDGSIVLAPG